MKLEDHHPETCKHCMPDTFVAFRIIEQERKETFEYFEKDNHLLFVLEGEISLDFNEYKNCMIKADEMFFLPALVRIRWAVLSTVKLVIFKNSDMFFPWTGEAADRLLEKKQAMTFEGTGIPMKEEISLWVRQIMHYDQTGLSCNHIMAVKRQELNLLLEHFYTEVEIVQLFYNSLGTNLIFKGLVRSNYMKVKTTEELALLLGYGVKTFRKLFKENFGETPSKWMQKQMLLQIKRKLQKRDMSFKQIMFECQFTSSSHFYHYCRKHLGATPTQIRNGDVSFDDWENLKEVDGSKLSWGIQD